MTLAIVTSVWRELCSSDRVTSAFLRKIWGSDDDGVQTSVQSGDASVREPLHAEVASRLYPPWGVGYSALWRMPAKGSVLVVTSPAGASPVREALAGESFELVATAADQALVTLEDRAIDAVVLELVEGHEGTTALLGSIQDRWPGLPVVLITDDASPERIAELVGLGASDLLLRPFAPAQLLFAVQKALAAAEKTAAAPPPPRAETGIVFGRTPTMQALRELLEQVAPSTSTVLVRGESGTGKELVARALHRLSPRVSRPFIKIDCTSLPETLIESELFGYEKGAFTGATAQKLGRVQLADTGTLFLDEVGELPLPVQAKLLRLLQDREFERLGGKQTLRVDVRVVAATHRDLEGMVQKGEFRQDLFYRLNVVPMWIAPLRARRADVPELATYFCEEVVKASGRAPVALGADALKLLASQRWPGNARQLQNFVERLVVLCRGGTITEADVKGELERPVRFATETGTVGADASGPPEGDGAGSGKEGGLALDAIVKSAERQALVRALDQAGGNRSAAARLLGVSRTTLYTKLEEYGLL
ncbi:MAG TPA: sigma-54 dependent transcriptional regulator [Polyangiaceae bacterium]|nr:sigma-54 dependent transcriptional regulator [Polyangiaceae bacterium]